MPVAPTYPGVYVEEIPSGVRTITGVATSIGAFVDTFAAGPMDKAVQLLSYADFERQLGGLSTNSEASYAIQQFFLNGGTEAYAVRVGSTTGNNAPGTASIGAATDGTGTTTVLGIAANSPGAWGNSVGVDIDYQTTDPTKQFNLTATEYSVTNGIKSIVSTETFRNLVVDPTNQYDVAAVVNAGSQLIKVTEVAGATAR